MQLLVLAPLLLSASAFSPVARVGTTRWATRIAAIGEIEEDAERKIEINEVMKPALDEECDMSNEAKCREFEAKMVELKGLMAQASTINDQIQSELLAVQNLKLDSMPQSEPIDESAYLAAKAAAEEASKAFGAASAEARAAWDIVGEIEDAGEYAVKMGSLDDECIASSSAKCIEYQTALDELQKAIISADSTEYNKSI